MCNQNPFANVKLVLRLTHFAKRCVDFFEIKRLKSGTLQLLENKRTPVSIKLKSFSEQ
jgi:hypothetical protein